jgi:hypothetical protein
MENIVSAHKITNDKEFSFDPTIYSKFKYGCVSSSVAMAEELVRTFLHHDKLYNIVDEDTEIVIVPYAYRSIPSAATFLADNIRLILNWHYHNKGLCPVSSTKIHREVICEPDFGTLSEEERNEILSNERLSLNEDIVKNKFVLFVDDIRVTGAHERLVESMINTYPHKSHIHLYYAETAPGIVPTIENTLNKFYVKGGEELVEILSSKHYMAARMIKEILRLDRGNISRFVNSFSTLDLFINIINHAIAEGYDKLSTFKNNFNYLKNIVKHEFDKSEETTGH